MMVVRSQKREIGEKAEERLALFAEIEGLGAKFDISLADRNTRGSSDIFDSDQLRHLSAVGAGYYRYLIHEAVIRHTE